MNKKGFTLVEVIAVVALLAILIGLAGTSFVKKYNESKKEAIIIQEGQLVQSGDMVVQDYCKNPLSEGYQLQCDNYFQPYEDSNENLIIEDNTYTKYICVKDLKKLGYYSEELRYSGVDCSGVVIYKIDYETDLQKESYSVIQCGEDYITEVENANDYLTNFKECFDTPAGGGSGETEEEKKYLLTVNFTELTPSGMKVGTSHNEKYTKGTSIEIRVPEYSTFDNEYTPFKHGSSQNAGNFNLSSDKSKLTGTMPEGNVVVNIVYSASTYVLTVNYKEFNDVQGNINFPSKQYTMYYGEEVEFPHESVDNFKIISPNKFTYQMEQEDHEIDVIYQQIDFNLTYNSNGGTTCNSRSVTYNKPYGTLCTPTRTGYTFNGWYLNGTQITATTTNTNYNNITLTAKWTPNKYYMVYNCNGGTPTTNYSSEHTYDETSNLATNRCVKTGYVFTGWLASNGSAYSNEQSIKNILSENNSSLTLTAQWTPLTYYVAFAPNSGSGSMSGMTLRYGQVVNLTANTFTRTGHRFDGWSGSNGSSYSDEASITNLTTTHGATITMTAKWTKCGAGTYLANNVCTACPAGKYSTGGVNSCTACPVGTYTSTTGKSACTTCTAGTYNTGTGNTKCNSCEAGYYCTGGSHKAACVAGKYSDIGASSCSICTVGYYCPGASNKIACPTGHTSSAGASECTKINYTITISVNNSSYGTVSASTVSIPYGTTYTASGNKITFSNGTVVTASIKTATGYTTTFSSWSSTSGTITGARTITANFARTPIKYTITTAVNNSSYGTVTDSISVAYGTTYTSSGVNITFSDDQKITATIKTATGYTTTFTGWTNGSGTVTGSKTITANFSRRGNNYSVVYNCNGGTPTNSYTSSHVYGTSSQLADNQCVKTGYSFTGWKDSSGNTYTNKQSVSTLVSTDGGSITLTAQWSPRTYTVTLNANGGSVSPSSITTTYNVSYNNLPTPTRTGYTFVGWFTGSAAKDSSKAYKSYPWLYYADTYSDLYNAYGYNEANLENHYNAHGKSEGRRTSQYINSDVYITQGNQTLYAGWSPNKNTKYVVNHYKQNIDGTYPSTPSETQTLYGTTAASLNLSGLKKTYDGYGYKESKNSSGTVITSASIAADGSTVINMYYVQYYITMYYHPNGADTIKFNGTSYSDADFVSTTTQPFHWELDLTYGVPDVQNASWFYLSRSGYRTTKYWYDSNGVRISEAEAMTVKEFAQKFNLDLAHGNQTLHLYAEWEKCAAGTYANVPNNSCDACIAGKYSAAGASSCSTCAAGTYNTGTGNTSCSNCTEGYYCSGGASKVACPAGKWSSASAKSSSDCYNCLAGSYCPGNGVKTACAKNTYSLQGQSACTNCPTGYETYGTGATQCFPKTYTITFNANGGSVSTTSKTVTYNGEIGDLPVPTRSGYKFFGWFDGTTTAQDDSSKLYKDHPMLHYSDYNYDLKEAFGYNEASLLDHYLTYGVNEPARYVGQYRSQDKWTTDGNLTLYAGWYTEAITVTINAGVNESVTCTHPSDSSKSFTVTTNSTGSASTSITAGTYTCTGAMSGYSKEVGITTNGQSVNIYPDGAIYWYGNGDSPNDSLYAVSGGFSSMAYKANGYGVGDSALRTWYLQHYDNYMYYYSDCTQYQNGYGGTLFNNTAFSMSGYSSLKTLLTVSKCKSSSCTSYTGAGSSNEVGLYMPTSKANNYDNSPSSLWTGTITDTVKSVSGTGNRYFALQLKSGYYWDSSAGSSKCSKTMITIKSIYRE